MVAAQSLDIRHQIRTILFAILAFCLLAATVRAAPDTPAITSATYDIAATGQFAIVQMDMVVLTSHDGWQTLPLIPATVPLKTFEVHGKRGYIERRGDAYVLNLMDKDTYRVHIEFVLDIKTQGAEESFILPLVRAVSQQVKLAVDKPDRVVHASPDMPVDTSVQSGRTVASLYPHNLDSVRIHWLPEAYEKKGDAAFEVREASRLVFSAGAVTRDTGLRVTVRRGDLLGLDIALPVGADVLRVEDAAPGQTAASVIKEWRITNTDEGRNLHVAFKQAMSGEFEIRIVSEQIGTPGGEGDASGTAIILPYDVANAARKTGLMGVEENATLTIVDAGSPGMNRAASDAFATIRPTTEKQSIALAFEYHNLPASLALRFTPVLPRTMATTASHVRLQAGIVELLTRIDYRIENAPVERFSIALDEGIIVLDVTGDDIDRWNVSGTRLDVRLRRPVRGNYALSVKGLQNLRRVNGVLIPRVRCEGVERESGMIGVSAGEDIALLHHHANRFVQVEVTSLPPWVHALRPKLAYLYDQPGGQLAVSTGLVKPMLHVEGFALASVTEDAVQEEIIFKCTVERRPVFSIRLGLPKGLTPVNLLGDSVADWEYHQATGSLLVSLARPVLGKTQIHLFAERRLDTNMNALDLGGIILHDADQFTGYLGIGTDANLDLVPVEVRGMTAMDIRNLPPLVSGDGSLRLAYTWTGETWGATLDARAITPRVEAETRTALLFGEGSMRTTTDITWHINNATLGEFLVRLPENAINSMITGANVRMRELNGNVWRVQLNDPVRGDYAMQVTFEQLTDRATGQLRYSGVRLPQAERQSGTIAAALKDTQIGVTVGAMRNAVQQDFAEGVDIGDYPFLDAFGYAGQDREIVFQMKGHAMARGVQLRADSCRIATVLKDDGDAVNYMNCRLRNAGAQFFRMRLPEAAKLWGTYVENKPVSPNTDHGEILVPILDAPRDRVFDLSVIWSEPTKKLGFGSELALASPKLDLPAQAVDWDVYLPKNYEIVQTSGNMKMLERQPWYRQGFPAIARHYGRRFWRPLVTGLKGLAWIVGIGVALWVFYRVLKAIVALSAKLAARRSEQKRRPAFSWVSALAILAILVVLAGLFLPALSRAREESRMSSSRNNLGQITKAMFTYTENYAGFYPPTLDALYPEYIGDKRAFYAPTSGERYRYRGAGLPPDAASDEPLVWEARGTHEGGRNIAYVDGSVRWHSTINPNADTAQVVAEADALDESAWHADTDSFLTVTEGRRRGDRDIGVKESRGYVLSDLPQAAPDAARVPARPESPAQSQPGMRGRQLDALDKLKSEQAARVAEKKAFEQHKRYKDALQLAEAYRKQGDYKQAEENLSRALQNAPADASDVVERQMRRLEVLQQETEAAEVATADGAGRMTGPVPSGAPHPGLPVKPLHEPEQLRKDVSAGALLTLSQTLNREIENDWKQDVASAGVEEGILQLLSGEGDTYGLTGGGLVTMENGNVAITGTDKDVAMVTDAVNNLRKRMIEKSRDITRENQQVEAQAAAWRRNEFKLMAMASKVKAPVSGGTITGSRGAGALPLEIAFPSAGTLAYPFHMDFAGESQARIDMTCVRASSAIVIQGAIALIALLVVGIVSWRRVKIGLPLAILVALALAFALHNAGEAAKPYVVMALAGLCLAAPVLLLRLGMHSIGHKSIRNETH